MTDLPAELAAALRMAEETARVLIRDPDNREDAAQAARLGVLRAWERYDPSRGVKFTTFAYRAARGYIRHYFRDTSNLPRPEYEAGLRPCDVFLSLEGWKAFHPGEGRARDAEEMLPAPEPWPGQEIPEELPAAVLREIALLPPRTRWLLWLRYWEGLPQTEVGRRLGVSQMHVSRIERRALARLREAWAE